MFSDPVMGLEETMAYPTVWLYILGSVNASRENTHIRANVLEIFVKTDRGHTISRHYRRNHQPDRRPLAAVLGVGVYAICLARVA